MTLRTFHKTIIKVWAISVLLYAGVIGATGTPVTFNSTIVPLVVLCALPGMALLVFRGAPPRTVAQVIYDEENASAELAKRLLKIEHAEALHAPRS